MQCPRRLGREDMSDSSPPPDASKAVAGFSLSGFAPSSKRRQVANIFDGVPGNGASMMFGCASDLTAGNGGTLPYDAALRRVKHISLSGESAAGASLTPKWNELVCGDNDEDSVDARAAHQETSAWLHSMNDYWI